MKNLIYIILLATIVFVACSNDNEEVRTLRVRSVDLSDLNIRRGIDTVAVEFNNLKRRELVDRFFTVGNLAAFNPILYDSLELQFNGGHLTYTFPQNRVKYKILSSYTYRNDTLFITKTDGSSFFVAIGTPEHLYRRKSLIRFPLTQEKDTAFALDEVLSLERSLQIARDISNRDFKEPTDTIAWCNILYNIE